jgi:hypothetical protein
MRVVEDFKHQLKPSVRKALEEMVSDAGDEYPARPVESSEHKHSAQSQKKPLRREQPHCMRMQVGIPRAWKNIAHSKRVIPSHPKEEEGNPADADHNAEPTEDCDGRWSLSHDESNFVGQSVSGWPDSTRGNSRCEEKKAGRRPIPILCITCPARPCFQVVHHVDTA